MTKKLNIEAVKLYIARKGQDCPFCGEQQIAGDSITINEGSASQEMGCNHCEEEWEDRYKLIGTAHGGVLHSVEDASDLRLPNIKELLDMLNDYETYLQDSSGRMETYERHEYTNDDRKAMQEKIAAVQTMQEDIAALGGAE